MANYDQFAAAVKEISGGKNIVLLDDLGIPSVYVPINKLKNNELVSGLSENIHPAFSVAVNGAQVEKDCFYYSKYQNVVINGSEGSRLPPGDYGRMGGDCSLDQEKRHNAAWQ